MRSVVAAVVVLLATVIAAAAQDDTTTPAQQPAKLESLAKFLGGGALALGAHEGGHLLVDVIFDADPGIKKVDFHGIPFFAITHREGLGPARDFTIASAGFWVQHATNEWILTRRPAIRDERAPLMKGMLAFNVLASVAYSGAAFARTGPDERDTRGMAVSADVDERWIGAAILAPALLDTWRYFDPKARTPVWLSRVVKVGGAVLIFCAASR